MTSTTIEKNYTTNTILKNWLTLRTKISITSKDTIKETDLENYNITID